MLRLLRRSTLFPYTTLFRSSRSGSVSASDNVRTGAQGTLPARTCKDRKSTRLNSSHANISYAVFCLKKKKKHTEMRREDSSLAAGQRKQIQSVLHKANPSQD